MTNVLTFKDLVTPDKWLPFEDHAKHIDANMASDIDVVISQNRTIRKEARKLLEDEYDIRRCDVEQLESAENELFKGNVVAIDGTHAVFPMLAGIRCQIGVVTTNYKNQQTTGAVYVSEQQVTGEETSVLGILRRRKKSQKRLSRMLIQAVMFYMERAIALERDEDWIMFNGDLCPLPLRTGVGSFRALEPCLQICARVMSSKKAIGVIANSTDSELVSLGLALDPGEYISLCSYKDDLDEYLRTSGLRGNDRVMMDEFNVQYADQFLVGVFRAGGKSYVFHAHRDRFDIAASIVIRDSMFQPLRAYPLLIDYADALCSNMLSSADFRKMVEFKLAKGKALEFEQDEQALRRR